VRARFLVGRLERGSAEVGMDSGIGSDMVDVWMGRGARWWAQKMKPAMT
jgi:hypothetical protein